eukprot:COSAG04_NODE_19617_length_412_cov_0.645367_1_plen_47_part_10
MPTEIQVGPTTFDTIVSDERVDLEAGQLYEALAAYLPHLSGASKRKY